MNKNNKGTALLVALLIMGVLIAISLALGALILGESRSTRELIETGRAYYAAESGLEEALYNLDTKLPGWEGEDINIGKIGDDAVFAYVVSNKCDSYPCYEPDEYDLTSFEANNYYDVLELNENITLPLFTLNDETGEVDQVEDFVVEFYVDFNPGTDLVYSNISGWDVLRWKAFSLRETQSGDYETESIHDFTAVSTLRNSSTGEEIASTALKPSWFGTDFCKVGEEGIECIPYSVFQGCSNLESRDFYLYDEDGFEAKLDCYPIKTFMQRNNTGLTYLSLTNLMNPAMFNTNIRNKKEASKIYFRVDMFGKDTVREFAKVTSDGFSGKSKQSLSVEIKRDSYMPVFNFTIYSTYGADDFYLDEE